MKKNKTIYYVLGLILLASISMYFIYPDNPYINIVTPELFGASIVVLIPIFMLFSGKLFFKKQQFKYFLIIIASFTLLSGYLLWYGMTNNINFLTDFMPESLIGFGLTFLLSLFFKKEIFL